MMLYLLSRKEGYPESDTNKLKSWRNWAEEGYCEKRLQEKQLEKVYTELRTRRESILISSRQEKGRGKIVVDNTFHNGEKDCWKMWSVRTSASFFHFVMSCLLQFHNNISFWRFFSFTIYIFMLIQFYILTNFCMPIRLC